MIDCLVQKAIKIESLMDDRKNKRKWGRRGQNLRAPDGTSWMLVRAAAPGAPRGCALAETRRGFLATLAHLKHSTCRNTTSKLENLNNILFKIKYFGDHLQILLDLV